MQVKNLRELPNRAHENIRTKHTLYCEAMAGAHNFWVDELDMKISSSRQRVNLSFSAVLALCCEDKRTHWTIIWRPKIFDHDIEHWEFGANTSGDVAYFLWIRVNDEEARKLFAEYGLEVA